MADPGVPLIGGEPLERPFRRVEQLAPSEANQESRSNRTFLAGDILGFRGHSCIDTQSVYLLRLCIFYLGVVLGIVMDDIALLHFIEDLVHAFKRLDFFVYLLEE